METSRPSKGSSVGNSEQITNQVDGEEDALLKASLDTDLRALLERISTLNDDFTTRGNRQFSSSPLPDIAAESGENGSQRGGIPTLRDRFSRLRERVNAGTETDDSSNELPENLARLLEAFLISQEDDSVTTALTSRGIEDRKNAFSTGKSFSPDIDNSVSIELVRKQRESVTLSEILSGDTKILTRYGYSFDGKKHISQHYTPETLYSLLGDPDRSDIELYQLEIPLQILAATAEFTTINSHLDLAPAFELQVAREAQTGLSRRLFIQPDAGEEDSSEDKGKSKEVEVINNCYDVWFLLPLFNLKSKSSDDDIACFYMKHDITTPKTTICFTKTRDKFGKFLALCEMSPRLDVRSDPFAFLSAGMSTIVDEFALARHWSSANLRKIEQEILPLDSIGAEEEARFQEFQLELHKFRASQLHQLSSFECLERIAKESISEHESTRQFLEIPESTFIRVHKNLESIYSWVQSMTADVKSSLTRADACLKTLSYLFTLKKERAGRDGKAMKELVYETKSINRAVKRILQMTMFYVAISFVVLLSSILRLNFDNGQDRWFITMTPWLLYGTIALPLTAGIYFTIDLREKLGKTCQSAESAEKELHR